MHMGVSSLRDGGGMVYDTGMKKLAPLHLFALLPLLVGCATGEISFSEGMAELKSIYEAAQGGSTIIPEAYTYEGEVEIEDCYYKETTRISLNESYYFHRLEKEVGGITYYQNQYAYVGVENATTYFYRAAVYNTADFTVLMDTVKSFSKREVADEAPFIEQYYDEFYYPLLELPKELYLLLEQFPEGTVFHKGLGYLNVHTLDGDYYFNSGLISELSTVTESGRFYYGLAVMEIPHYDSTWNELS